MVEKGVTVNPEIAVRAAEPSEAARIAELQNLAYGPEEAHIIEQPAVTPEDLLHEIIGGQWIVAANTQGEIVGCACLSRRGLKLLISGVAVEPVLQRRGIGRALMGVAELRASAQGAAATILSVLSARADRLVPYYRSQGYEEVARRPLAGGQGLRMPCEMIIMEKPLHRSDGG